MAQARQAPPRTRRPKPEPALLGLLGGAAASGVLVTVLAGRTAELLAAETPWRIEGVVEAVVTAGGAAVAGWLTLSATLALLCVLARLAGSSWRAGERLVHRAAPALVRRALVVAIGAGLGLTGATAAGAAAPAPPPVTVAQAATSATGDLGWAPTPPTGASPEQTDAGSTDGTRPDDAASPGSAAASPQATGAGQTGATAAVRDGAATTQPVPTEDPSGTPAVSQPPAAPRAAAASDARPSASGAPAGDAHGTPSPAASPAAAAVTPAATTGATVVVQPGDTLWSLAARHLPAGADDATIARTWPLWHEANAATIGADPDVLRPGQVLTIPTTAGGAR